jgi:hypothetical protein
MIFSPVGKNRNKIETLANFTRTVWENIDFVSVFSHGKKFLQNDSPANNFEKNHEKTLSNDVVLVITLSNLKPRGHKLTVPNPTTPRGKHP